jgi:hypothetical protein
VTGTIGGNGRRGTATDRSAAQEKPAAKPANAASGRRAPDAFDLTAEPVELVPGHPM